MSPLRPVGLVGLDRITIEPDLNMKEFVMPGGDGTGPMGTGPVQGRGRGRGFCGGHGGQGFAAPGGQGRGGRGRPGVFCATGMTGAQRTAADVQDAVGEEPAAESPESQQLVNLEQQAKVLVQTLAQVREDIADLRSQQGQKA